MTTGDQMKITGKAKELLKVVEKFMGKDSETYKEVNTRLRKGESPKKIADSLIDVLMEIRDGK